LLLGYNPKPVGTSKNQITQPPKTPWIQKKKTITLITSAVFIIVSLAIAVALAIYFYLYATSGKIKQSSDGQIY